MAVKMKPSPKRKVAEVRAETKAAQSPSQPPSPLSTEPEEEHHVDAARLAGVLLSMQPSNPDVMRAWCSMSLLAAAERHVKPEWFVDLTNLVTLIQVDLSELESGARFMEVLSHVDPDRSSEVVMDVLNKIANDFSSKRKQLGKMVQELVEIAEPGIKLS